MSVISPKKKNILLLIISVLLFLVWIRIASEPPKPEVNTPLGKIIGKTVYFQDSAVTTFQGIPYAKPPIGKYRFKKPRPMEAWRKPLVADHLPPGCVQYTSNLFPWFDSIPDTTLDCLYLNIWVPATGENVSKKAVILWIHLGEFRIGSSRLDLFDGSALAALGDVLVVTVNYRFGAEGFLYSGTDDAPGNMGLFDILETLKWVNSNIDYFGGDKDRVTLNGHCSGAIIASMLMVSPLAKGLFARAILQSGSAINMDGEDNDRDFRLSQALAEAVGCASDESSLRNDPQEVVNCLRGKDGLELAKTIGSVSPTPLRDFYPRYGDAILPLKTREAIRAGHFENIELLIGNVRNEGAEMITKSHPAVFEFFGQKDSQMNKTFGEYIIRQYFDKYPKPEAVVQHYLGHLNEKDSENVLYQVQMAYGDYYRVCPSVFLAESVGAMGNQVFYYYFVHRPSDSPWASWMGVSHAEEMSFVFGYPLRYPDNFTPLELNLSKQMISIWSTFAKTGSPGLLSWPVYTRDEHYYYTLDTVKTRVETGPHLENCNFFRPYFGF